MLTRYTVQRSVWLLTIALTTPPLAAQPPAASINDPREVFTQADAALKRIRTVRYHGKFDATGYMVNFSPVVEGRVILQGKSAGIRVFRYDVKAHGLQETAPIEYSSGSDGSLFYVINPDTRKVHVGADAAVGGRRGLMAQAVGLEYFVHPNPFGDELNARHLGFMDDAEIHGEDCYVIRVKYADERGDAVWHIAKKDLLPRKLERMFINDQGVPGTIRWVVSDLEVNPNMGPDAFRLVVPEGYTRVSDPSP